MRKSKQETAESRAKILRTAARLLREKGVEGASIANVMLAAGMTQGGFYRHFKSKNDMLAEATRHAFHEVTERFDHNRDRAGAEAALKSYVAQYLSKQHIERPGAGCPTAGFGSDAGRIPKVLGPEFVRGAEGLVERTTSALAALKKVGDPALREEAIRMLALLVGTVVIARATGDTPLRQEIIGAAKAVLSGD